MTAAASKHRRKRRHYTIGDFIIWAIMLLAIVVTLYPVLTIVAGSFTDPVTFLAGGVGIIPKNFTLENYRKVFMMKEIWTAYANTIFYTVCGTAVSVVITCMYAYSLSKRRLVGRKMFTLLLMFTMMFSGGMIPHFLVNKSLGLYDNPLVMIIPGALTAWNVILARTFFESIPAALEESAKIDGANDIVVFAKVYLPLSLPIVATVALYIAVAKWNDFTTPLLYFSQQEHVPLSLLLRRWLISDVGEGDPSALSNTVRNYTAIIVTMLPIVCVYPFIQKYFQKGMMVGAIKG